MGTEVATGRRGMGRMASETDWLDDIIVPIATVIPLSIEPESIRLVTLTWCCRASMTTNTYFPSGEESRYTDF